MLSKKRNRDTLHTHLKIYITSKTKLNSIEKNTLSTTLKGGEVACGCGCRYEGKGGIAFVYEAYDDEVNHI